MQHGTFISPLEGSRRLAMIGRTFGLAAIGAVSAAVFADARADDMQAVAKTMVQAAGVRAGEKVVISGSVRDAALLEDLAIETMKAGGQPLITLSSEKLDRRSYDEVPASYDSHSDTLGLANAATFDVAFPVDYIQSETLMAGVPAARLAARAAAAQPVTEAYIKRGVRAVNLGNGLYPSANLAERLGKTQTELESIFWKAAAVSPEVIRSKGNAIRAALASASRVRLSSKNGTDIAFGLAVEKGFISDGTITSDKVQQGHAATFTWLPAGELLIPVSPGTAEGKVAVDKVVFQGITVESLVMTFSKGTLASMTAKSGLDALKSLYDASSGGKDQFSFIDLGLNPEAKLPTTTGRIVWMAPGGVTIGVGDNTLWGGTNASSFVLAAALTAATLSADGRALIENGALK
jgi:leucyl aminopeptidase (aminopeptidase T)